ncbi:MAG TPA: hypothetical protein PK509_08985 [Catalimonadaceae bacterium]|nr:hypothetical protein [Catalimonadaceae bacterium]
MAFRILAFVLTSLLITGYINRKGSNPDPQNETRQVSPEAVPDLNKQLLEYARKHGTRISPTYEKAVCTEFLIQVIEPFRPLTKKEKNDIRILTKEPLGSLVEKDDPVIKGVQTALVSSGKGEIITRPEDVLPGDLVQFWTSWLWYPTGHCGVVVSLQPGKKLTLYSSHPFTNGFGKYAFEWPGKTYFVRLKPE